MSTKRAIVKHLSGVTFAAKSDSNHWIMMDGPESLGGSNAAPRPKELLLFALGGCTGSDVASIMNKKRVRVEDFEIQLNAVVSEEHPQVFTEIHIEYVFFGDEINKQDVERAIELSTSKYCAVSAMLKPSIRITHSYRIESPRVEPRERSYAQL